MALEKTDINLMQLKETKRSQTSGNIFGNLKGSKDFHPFGGYPIGALEGKSLNELATMFLEYQALTEQKFDKVIQVLKHQREKIQELEGVLEKYGL